MPKYIKHYEWGEEWMMLKFDCGNSDLIAVFVSAVGSLPLEKRGEFRVVSGVAIPNLGNTEVKSTDGSGIERSIRGHIIEVDDFFECRRGFQ